MSFKVMPKEALTRWVTWLQSRYEVVGPKEVHGQFIFDKIASPDELRLDYTQSILPPKKVLLPQREELVRFSLDGSRIEPVFDGQPTVVLGVHTCDLYAIQLLDKVFTTGFTDKHYQRRRENTALVSIECLRPCSPHSFCKSMGTLSLPETFDLHLTDLGDVYAVDIGSEWGQVLLNDHAETRPATDEEVRRLNQVLAQKWASFPYRLDFDVGELPSLLRVSYNSPVWEELGQRCLGCAACTNVCPTCYCFNVQDEVDFALSVGRRVRLWDSCQLNDFAKVAGGHDFRPTRLARQRHRFLRKGQYQTEAYGLLGCVGCGRCALACLVHITPIETFNALYHEHRRNAGEMKVLTD